MKKNVFYVMGVSGCGKSSIGKFISSCLSIDYVDSDDFHPNANVEKMRNGVPLTDQDRAPWLKILNNMATECIYKNTSLVIASSCLKPTYRKVLQDGISEKVVFIYLKGSFEKINERMKKRDDHYFSGESMLKSQFSSLIEPSKNEPIHFIEVEIDQLDIEKVVSQVIFLLKNRNYI